MRKLFHNISRLWGIEYTPEAYKSGAAMGVVDSLESAWLLVEDGLIAGFGTEAEGRPKANEYIDVKDRELLPGFVDSHTHAVFAVPREKEWRMRLQGASYEEIAENGGGILNSAARLRETAEEQLYKDAYARVERMIQHGSTTIEIKSGYGLDLDSELKMLRVIKRLKGEFPAQIRATFLGAHAIPAEYKQDREGYIELIIKTMLPQVAYNLLADHVDVFCDKGFFTPAETEKILKAAEKLGLPAKIHANELGLTGGVQTAVKLGAWSADHLEHCGEEEFLALKQSDTVPVALPGTSYFLGIPFAHARKMIAHELPLALASDFNPGSSPVCNMQMIWSLACSQMRMLPEEAFWACTLNAARALRLETQVGSVSIGKEANFFSTKTENAMQCIPYFFGVNHAEKVWVRGELFE
jgi:imidazolonepropionase